MEIVVCHGNVIRYMALRALQLPPQAWLRMAVNNASYTTLTVRQNGGVSMSGPLVETASGLFSIPPPCGGVRAYFSPPK